MALTDQLWYRKERALPDADYQRKSKFFKGVFTPLKEIHIGVYRYTEISRVIRSYDC